MEMRIKEGTLTYVKEFDDDVTPEEMLIGAFELHQSLTAVVKQAESSY